MRWRFVLTRTLAGLLLVAIGASASAWAFGWRPLPAASAAASLGCGSGPIVLRDIPSPSLGAVELPLAVGYHLDAAGIPIWSDGTWHPGGTAQLGLRDLTAGDRAGAQRMADTIVARAEPGMWLPYRFALPDGIIAEPVAPWYSAISQGRALALFSLLGDRAHADELVATLRPGSRVSRQDGADLWLEEYPTSPPDPVLNGDVFALFGLYDYWRLTGSPEAEDLVVRNIETVRRHLGEFVGPDGVWYDLGHRRTLWKMYWPIYVAQLDSLAAITGEACFSRARDEVFARWP